MEKQHVPTSSEIWKILKEVSLGQKENREQLKETDRLFRESKQKYDQMHQKNQEDLKKMIQENRLSAKKRAEENKLLTEKRAKENRLYIEQMSEKNRLHIKQIDSRWGNQWGILVEALTAGNLVQVLKERGIDVKRTLSNHMGCYQNQHREFDAIAIDGKELVVMEAKSHVVQEKVDYFLNTLQDFKKYCPEFSKWVVYGGVACLRKNPKVLSYAEEMGLFVIRIHGKNAIMLNKPEFKPKVFA